MLDTGFDRMQNCIGIKHQKDRLLHAVKIEYLHIGVDLTALW